MDVQVLLMLMIVSAADASSHWFVVSPNMIRLGHEEKVSVNVFGNSNNQQVEVWLEFNNKQFSKKTVVVTSEEKPENVTIKVTLEDIFDNKTSSKPQFVTLKSRCMNVEKQAELKVNYQNGYLILQTDKPLYKPGEQVNYRLLALDEDLKHAKDRPLTIDITDPKNRTVSRKRLTHKEKLYSYFFIIPKYSDLRLWTIRAYYMDQYTTEARVTFQVDEYELPTFGVDVTVQEDYCLLPSTKDFKVNVEAKYVYGKPVTGIASLKIFLYNDRLGSRKYVMSMRHRSLENGNHEFTILMDDIRNSNALTEEQFDNGNPESYYLKIDAVVLEYVTGNEENGTGSIIFAATPYKFEFTQSRPSYRPGQVYTLQVQMLHANGKPVADGFANVKMTNTGTNKVEEKEITIDEGLVLASFQTTQAASFPLTFQVEVDGDLSEVFIVRPYLGDNQVQIEMVIAKGKPQLRILTNTQGTERYTGLMMMIIARGNVFWSKFYAVTQEIHEYLDDNLMKKLSPSARAVVFYVNKQNGNEVISDSVQFQIKPTCQGDGLTLKAEKEEYTPGDIGKLTLQGEPHMLVGLNAMDAALLLLNRDSILTTNTMFRLLDQHDVGCGAGGGSSSSEVFRLAGVAVLTNANVVNVRRESLSCDENRRRKRDAGGCPVNERCCSEGQKYAMKIVMEKRELKKLCLDEGIDLKTKCYSYVLRLLKQDKHPAVCLNQWIKHCLLTVDNEEEDDVHMSGKSLGDESEYERDIRTLNKGEDVTVRAAFKETWLFQDVILDSDGKMETNLLVPQSITTYMIQGVGISDAAGVCIAEPVFVKSFRNFFIQLDIPYSAVRLENVPIKASIFNYYAGNITVHVYIEGVDGLCSSTTVGKQSEKQKAVIPGNNAASFDFLVLPLRAGTFEITVSAFAIASGVSQSDAVMKKLLVLPEGKEHTNTIHVCLDPLNQARDCVNDNEVKKVGRVRGEETLEIRLEIPMEAVPNTVQAIGYIKGNIMTEVVEEVISGTESLIKLPTGCCQQTMSKLAPLVYAMKYLKQTKQITSDIATNGYDYIRQGNS